MVDLDDELYDMKRAVAHLDLGIKAYRAAVRDEIDASRLLDSIHDEIGKLIGSAEEAQRKVRESLRTPTTAEG